MSSLNTRLLLSVLLLATAQAGEISFEMKVSPDDGSPTYEAVMTIDDSEDVTTKAREFCKQHDIMENERELVAHIHLLRGTPASARRVPNYPLDSKFWMRMAKSHIGREGKCSLAKVDKLLLRKANTQVRTNGYSALPNVIEGDAPDRLLSTAQALVNRGWHPLWIFLYDDFWYLPCGMAPLLSQMLGSGYKRTKRLLASEKIKPTREVTKHAEDGTPLTYTVWLPLHSAQGDSGGFYCIPKQDDHLFDSEESRGPYTRVSSKDEKHKKLASKNVFDADLSKVRSVPLTPGQYIVHSNALFHWQGQQEEDYKHLQTFSVGFEYTKSEGKEGEWDMQHIPTFDERLDLIVDQLDIDSLDHDQAAVVQRIKTPPAEADMDILERKRAGLEPKKEL